MLSEEQNLGNQKYAITNSVTFTAHVYKICKNMHR